MKRYREKAHSALSLILGASILALWLVPMLSATFTLAVQYRDLLRVEPGYAKRVEALRGLGDYFDPSDWKYHYHNENPDRLELDMVDSIGSLGAVLQGRAVLSGADGLLLTRRVPASAAVRILDREGVEVLRSTDGLYVIYADQASWENGNVTQHGNLWIDLDADPEMAAATNKIHEIAPYWPLSLTLRLTGYMDGAKMIPSQVSYSPNYGKDGWQTLLDRPAPEGTELVTVYSESVREFTFGEGDLLALLRQQSAESRQNTASLFRMYLYDTKSLGETVDGKWETAYTIETVVRCSPFLGAMKALKNVWTGSFFFACAVLGAALLIVHRNLTRPLEVLSAHMAGNWLPQLRKIPKWREPLELEEHFGNWQKERQELLDKQKELENTAARLEQALEYAGKAEENRRKMVSALAHELKTPLAVIHGYAEGLQENIAEEKRDQYLQTILSETEQMDGLVMELLDLSRLEAGRVVLARDRFCLTALTKDIFARLDKTAQDRHLRIEYPRERTMEVLADEGRIRQAVQNLASNAVRYTPEGGRILVKTEVMDGCCVLTVENDAAPFTEEEQERVWESFYRRETARHEKGTGLGLAIVKSIIRLHGGSCFVKNTRTGVAFGFRLPMA